jgi:Na+:H+ antiporter, NhaA family
MHEGPEVVREGEKLAGLLLIGAAALALVAANSHLAPQYHALLDARIGPAMPRLGVMSAHQWIADGLMAIFFLLVGLEIKREWYDGRLSTAAERRLPVLAAAAGMAVPALVYLLVTRFDPTLARGWAVPAATDIAFAVGVLALLGSRANPTVKLLLVTIAIVDDVGAVLIIALVYTANLDATAIGISLLILGSMFAMNRAGVRKLWPYLVAFGLLWVAMLASGIHPTVAGVLAAFCVPLGQDEERSPLKLLEHRIHPWVMFGIMPLFGFASAGVHLTGLSEVLQPLPVGIAAGLFLGKQLGVFGAMRLAAATGLAPKPDHARWLELYGASLLCGIGFTMSLFIGALAFPGQPEFVEAAKAGTLLGSLLSAICGFAVLRAIRPLEAQAQEADEALEIFGADQDEDLKPAGAR